jgi:hypothetical protein
VLREFWERGSLGKARVLPLKRQCSMDISICIEGRHMHSTSHIATYTESTIGTYPSYFHSPGVSAAVDTTNSRPGKFSPCWNLRSLERNHRITFMRLVRSGRGGCTLCDYLCQKLSAFADNYSHLRICFILPKHASDSLGRDRSHNTMGWHCLL